MSIEIVYETHALTEDNENGIATGWLPGRLSARGCENAADMGRRRRTDRIAAVFASDLRRAAQTAQIAFAVGSHYAQGLRSFVERPCLMRSGTGMPATVEYWTTGTIVSP